MAEKDSATPGITKKTDSAATGGALTPEHKKAGEAETPREKPAKNPDDNTPPEEKTLKDKAGRHFIPEGKTLATEGVTHDEDNTKTHGLLLDNVSMGGMFDMFLEMVAMLMRGDWEGFSQYSERFTKDVKVDPAVQGLKNKVDKVLVKAKDIIDDTKTTTAEKTKAIGKLATNDPLIKSLGVGKLIGLITKTESDYGKPNIVFDYRNKPDLKQHNLGKETKGFEPGQKTPGGLTVPTFTNMTVNEVIQWQRQYLDEQYTAKDVHGDTLIPNGTGSSATGAYQFTMTTLDGMVKQGDIKGTDKFTLENQTNFALFRMIRINGGFKRLLKDNIQDKDYNEIADSIGKVWLGLAGPNGSPSNLIDALKEMRDTTLKNHPKTVLDSPANLKAIIQGP